MSFFGMPSCPLGLQHSGIREVSRSTLASATQDLSLPWGSAPEQPSAKAELGWGGWRRCLPRKVGGKCSSSTRPLCLICFRAKPAGSVALLPQSLPFQPILLICAALIPSKPQRLQELGEVRECRELIINEAHKLPY